MKRIKLQLKYTARLLWAALLGVEALAKVIFESSSFADEDETLRIVLIGKTGVGKSSLANTIVQERDAFEVNHSSSSLQTSRSVTRTVNGKRLLLIDTPGFFDSNPNMDIHAALLDCIEKSLPGPHAFLLVLKVDRFTKHEQEAVDLMLEYFSKDVLSYTAVVFTHGDFLQEGIRIEDWVSQNEALNSLVQKCGGRCHVVDNRYWNNSQDEYRNNQLQVSQLLQKIEEMVEQNSGRHYTNKLLQGIQETTEPKEKQPCNIL